MSVAVTTSPVTHADLVRVAERWLRRKHPVVLVDVHSATTNEQPDAIGWTNAGFSTLIECKVSRSDFRRDAKKWYRPDTALGMGAKRYVLAPDNLLDALWMPPGWGLLYAATRGVRIVHESATFFERDSKSETALLIGAVRRATEGWGRRTFGATAPPMVDGDPHPTASAIIRDLRGEVQKLRDQARERTVPHVSTGQVKP